MIKKIINKSLYGLILTIIFGSQLNATQVNFKLEHANLTRIESLTDKYYKKFSHVRNIKKLTYTVIGLAGVAGTAWYIHDKMNDKHVDEKEQPKSDTAPSELNAAMFKFFLKTSGKKYHEKPFTEMLRKQIKNGLVLGIAGIIIKMFWDAAGTTSNGIKDFWAWGNINNVQAYQEKQAKLKDLLLKLAMAPELDQNQEFTDGNKALIEIYMSDFILTQRTMIYYLEDMLAYLKFLVLLSYGEESNEFMATDKNCAILCAEFNNISDKISLIINHDEKADKQAIISDYANFCRKFTKFICDCGVCLYGQDFLQK